MTAAKTASICAAVRFRPAFTSSQYARCAPPSAAARPRRPWPTVSKNVSSCFSPSGVPTDSGWYCTPSTANSLCLRPMISPSSLSAVTARQSGRLARSTAREW